MSFLEVDLKLDFYYEVLKISQMNIYSHATFCLYSACSVHTSLSAASFHMDYF